MMETVVEGIWETFNGQLSRFIHSRVDDPYAADDLLQDVYLKIHTNIHRLRDDQRLQAWVYQIARNAIHDYYRVSIPLDAINDSIPCPESDSDAEAIDELRQRLSLSVRAMIDCLPHEYREALLLTEFEGMTQQELAAHLGISVPGAKSRVQRARKMLRELLNACCAFQFDHRGTVIDYHPHDANCCTGIECAYNQ